MKRKSIILISIFTIVIGILGVFLLFNNSENNKKIIDPENAPIKYSQSENLIKPDKSPAEIIPEKVINNEIKELSFLNNELDVSDWKIYRNKELGFEVKYPNEWAPELMIGGMFGEMNEGENWLIFKKNNNYMSTRILIKSDNFSESKQRWIQLIKTENGSYQNIKINDIFGIKFTLVRESQFGQERYIFDGKDKTISFFGTKEEDRKKFEQILLSFKLVK